MAFVVIVRKAYGQAVKRAIRILPSNRISHGGVTGICPQRIKQLQFPRAFLISAKEILL